MRASPHLAVVTVEWQQRSELYVAKGSSYSVHTDALYTDTTHPAVLQAWWSLRSELYAAKGTPYPIHTEVVSWWFRFRARPKRDKVHTDALYTDTAHKVAL